MRFFYGTGCERNIDYLFKATEEFYKNLLSCFSKIFFRKISDGVKLNQYRRVSWFWVVYLGHSTINRFPGSLDRRLRYSLIGWASVIDTVSKCSIPLLGHTHCYFLAYLSPMVAIPSNKKKQETKAIPNQFEKSKSESKSSCPNSSLSPSAIMSNNREPFFCFCYSFKNCRFQVLSNKSKSKSKCKSF